MSQTLYDRDFDQWAEQQADLLRSGCLDQLDAANVAEEIESLAKRDKRELRSRSAEIVEHLLKLSYRKKILR